MLEIQILLGRFSLVLLLSNGHYMDLKKHMPLMVALILVAVLLIYKSF